MESTDFLQYFQLFLIASAVEDSSVLGVGVVQGR